MATNHSHPTSPTSSVASSGADVPLAVWPVAQTSGRDQRAGRYLPASAAHRGALLPELARRIVGEYSTVGQLIVDPMAGIGTSLIEAALLGRRAFGVELQPRRVALAQANLDHALNAPQRKLATITTGDAGALTAVLGERAGTVDLIIAAPPNGDHGVRSNRTGRAAGSRLCPRATVKYAADRDNLGPDGRDYPTGLGEVITAGLAQVITAGFAALRPGGRLVTVTRNMRRGGRCVDRAGTTVRVAQQAGFGYLQHVIALQAAVRDGTLTTPPSDRPLTQPPPGRSCQQTAHVLVHQDVCVFTKPAVTR